MEEINLVIYGIIALFFALLAIKSTIKNKKVKEAFCVICASISLTWVALLILYWSGLFKNTSIIALLIGMSVTGIYYLIDGKIKKNNKSLGIFKLPLILTLIITAYYVLTLERVATILLVIATLWLLFVIFYSYKNTKFAKKILECCREI